MQSSVKDLRERASRVRWQRDSAQRSLDMLRTRLDSSKHETVVLTSTQDALRAVSEELSFSTTRSLTALVNHGLREVFPDRDYHFDVSAKTYRGKGAVELTLSENGVERPLTKSYGGGILAVIGVLLRIYTVQSLGLRRVLVLDETLNFLSKRYQENMSYLLSSLAKEMKYSILVITHSDTLASHATKRYEVYRKRVGAGVRLLAD